MSALSICFIDLINWDYDVSTPLKGPLGGSQSALCYLAMELAKRGHRVVSINKGNSRGIVEGVEMISVPDVRREYMPSSNFDAVIVLNGPSEHSSLRQELPLETVLVLWSQHAANQSAMWNLARSKIRKRWDKIVCVAETHRRNLIKQYPIPADQIEICGNAISPAFESLFASEADLRARKARPVKLAYSSTPFRGLDVLLDVFPRLTTPARLEIYSSMKVYQIAPADDPYRALYERARQTPNVAYIGSLSQPELARAMTEISIFSYPSTFEEMYCVSVVEAMAAGALIVATDLGALPETTLGYGDLVAYDPKGDRGDFVERYRARLQSAVDAATDKPDALLARCYAQVQEVNAKHTWRVRASEWEKKIVVWKAERAAKLGSVRTTWKQ